jgi:hypothetical protein
MDQKRYRARGARSSSTATATFRLSEDPVGTFVLVIILMMFPDLAILRCTGTIVFPGCWFGFTVLEMEV